VGEVGMLVADPAQRGTGIGGALIRFAERWCAQQGLDTVQLEVLVPRNWTRPSKEGLKDWYSRLGTAAASATERPGRRESAAQAAGEAELVRVPRHDRTVGPRPRPRDVNTCTAHLQK
jgi:hypothetical protein